MPIFRSLRTTLSRPNAIAEAAIGIIARST
jgi:hypothetical protein